MKNTLTYIQIAITLGVFLLQPFWIAAQNIDTQKLVDSLITAYDKPYPNDSARADIAYRLGQINSQQEFGCAKCIQFLIEHCDVQYIYGDGISENDQNKSRAAYLQLARIAKDHHRKWSLLQPLFDALKIKTRSPTFIRRIFRLLTAISDAPTAKVIVTCEISKNAIDPNFKRKHPDYQVNLQTLLEMFDQ